MGLPFLYEKMAESKWRAMVWVCDEKSNAVINSLKKVYKFRSTRWWQSLHTRMMKKDSENRHLLGREGRLDDCTNNQNSPKDKYKFITYILNKMKLPTEHRKTKKKDE